ncbi:MAG TPA: CotH kinase family protein [Candidatus Paceibacterota bacterium]|nr:CotH kinase family protein [Verrucomicrobiota bacterium]HRY51355.1 CotH kinase family protein [Candidatus Paceibacterota bacterium]
MKLTCLHLRLCVLALGCGLAAALLAQAPNPPAPAEDGRPPADGGERPPWGGPDSGGPPPFGRGGFGPGGPGMQQETKLLKQFDKDGNGWLNSEERKAAREFKKERVARDGRGFGPRPFGGRENGEPAQPGRKLTPADVKSLPNAPIYGSNVLRTFFLEFENADWEKELADFNDTDVEVPAKLMVDGMTFPDVGVHFRGMTSFMMVPEGRKRSLNVSLDFIHKGLDLGGYRTFNLLNASEDPSFLHSVLFFRVAREYIPAPQANFVRVVINGECWGIYPNVQQVNKDFVKDWFNTTKGARWKVPGSPNGRGGLSYLGEDVAAYKRIYTIKSKDEPQAWGALIRLCKVLNQTPAEKLEEALAPMLDIEGTLKFLALDNAFANGDGFWSRASDYYLYQDEKGKFHCIPNDVNETFSTGGGPGGSGGPGGPGGRGGPGGPGGFGPGMFIAAPILEQADKNRDGKLAREEFAGLAGTWFDKLDPDSTGKLTQEQFVAKVGDLLPPPQGFGPPGGGMPGNPPQDAGFGGGRAGQRGGFGPATFIGPGLFTVSDVDKDGSLTRTELKETFVKWFGEWDPDNSGTINEEKLRAGLNAALPRPNFGGPGGGRGGFGGRGRGGPPGFGANTDLDPLIAANDENKPLISKLLAVPVLRARYLGYIREIAEKWMDWNVMGPIAEQYHALIADDVKADTRKLYSTEAFSSSLAGGTQAEAGAAEPQASTLKSFLEKRRAYLLNRPEVKQAAK